MIKVIKLSQNLSLFSLTHSWTSVFHSLLTDLIALQKTQRTNSFFPFEHTLSMVEVNLHILLQLHQLKPVSVPPNVPLRSCLVTDFIWSPHQLVYCFLKALYPKKKKKSLTSPNPRRINAFFTLRMTLLLILSRVRCPDFSPLLCYTQSAVACHFPFPFPTGSSPASQHQSQTFPILHCCIWFALFTHGALHLPLLIFTLLILCRLSNLSWSLRILMLSSKLLANLPVTLPMYSLCSVTQPH